MGPSGCGGCRYPARLSWLPHHPSTAYGSTDATDNGDGESLLLGTADPGGADGGDAWRTMEGSFVAVWGCNIKFATEDTKAAPKAELCGAARLRCGGQSCCERGCAPGFVRRHSPLPRP